MSATRTVSRLTLGAFVAHVLAVCALCLPAPVAGATLRAPVELAGPAVAGTRAQPAHTNSARPAPRAERRKSGPAASARARRPIDAQRLRPHSSAAPPRAAPRLAQRTYLLRCALLR